MANATKGRFVWYEHITRDPKAAIAFYGEVVGWRTQPFGDGGYEMWVGSQGPLGGVMAAPPPSPGKPPMPPHWMAHVLVDDVDATAKLATELGGRVCHPPTDIPTVGRFSVLGDPQGATLSVFRPNGPPMALHDPAKEGEFRWNELATTDGVAALAFYGRLFGWSLAEEMDMGPAGKYRIFRLGETQLGGMFDIPKGAPVPVGWLYYVGTADLDAATRRATQRGAKVLNGPMDVPGGRIIQLVDPEGAAFALHEAARR